MAEVKSGANGTGSGDHAHSQWAWCGGRTMQSLTRSRGATLVCLALSLLLQPGCQRRQTPVALEMVRGHIVLATVKVSRTEGLFLLDTGSGGTIVCPELGSRLGQSSKRGGVSSFGGGDRVREVVRVKSKDICFAGSRLKYPEEVSVLDLDFLTNWADRRVAGILGWDVLREYVWGIDLHNAVLLAGRNLSPKEILGSFGVLGPADATLPLGVGDRPLVTAHVGSKSLRLELDTGAERTVLSAGAFRRLGLELPPNAALSMTRGVNGDATGHLARLAEFRLGPLVWSGLEVIVSDDTDWGEDEGLLGMDLLSNYLMVFDGPSRTLYLAKHVVGTQ